MTAASSFNSQSAAAVDAAIEFCGDIHRLDFQDQKQESAIRADDFLFSIKQSFFDLHNSRADQYDKHGRKYEKQSRD